MLKKHCNHKNTQYTNIYEKNKKMFENKIKKKKKTRKILSHFYFSSSLFPKKENPGIFLRLFLSSKKCYLVVLVLLFCLFALAKHEWFRNNCRFSVENCLFCKFILVAAAKLTSWNHYNWLEKEEKSISHFVKNGLESYFKVNTAIAQLVSCNRTENNNAMIGAVVQVTYFRLGLRSYSDIESCNRPYNDIVLWYQICSIVIFSVYSLPKFSI